MSQTSHRLFISLLTILIFFVGGLLGILFSPYIQLNTLPTSISKINEKGIFNTKESVDLKLLWEAYEIVKDNFYSFNDVSSKDIVYGIIKGMTLALKDKHTEYFTPDETQKFNEALTGDFEGIGAVILHSDFGVLIDRLLAGSPAKEADLRSGDVVVKANDIDLKDLELTDAVNKIRGPAGTKVKLEIIRPGVVEKIIKEVTRRKIEIPSVEGKTLSGSIGYIALSIFGEKTSDDFKKELDTLYSQKITGLIIDLRDNGGGFLDSAVDILSNFVDKDKVLVVTKEKNPFLNRSYFSKGVDPSEKIVKNIPIVILINGNSASASEITAGALKDYKRAILVGEKSYGKGSVQEPFNLSDGSEIKVTVAKWYTPLDHGIDGIGIEPDVTVIFKNEDYDKKYDRQLEEAKKVIKQYVEKGYDKTLEDIKREKEKASSEAQKINPEK